MLICLPYAGGSSTFYNKWKQFLPSNIEMCVYELAGRGTRSSDSTNYTCIEDIAADLFSQMDADNLFSKPYYLFGHSLGALITIKLCNLIREKGRYYRLIFSYLVKVLLSIQENKKSFIC